MHHGNTDMVGWEQKVRGFQLAGCHLQSQWDVVSIYNIELEPVIQ